MDAKTGIVSAAGVAVGVMFASFVVNSYHNDKTKKRSKSKSRASTSSETTEKHCLLKNPESKYQIRFVKKAALTPDTKRFRFQLPDANEVLGCPVGNYVVFTAKVNGKTLSRPYTPISSVTDKGFVEFVIKVYYPNADFPQGGVFSQFLDSLKKGDLVSISGPLGSFEYAGEGRILTSANCSPSSRTNRESRYKCLGMVTGGSGITPMYQIIKAIISNPKDSTKVVLLYASRDEQNIILRNELDAFEEQHPESFKVHYIVDKKPMDSRLTKGPITEEFIKERMPSPGADVAAFVSGPPEMVNLVCIPGIDATGYDQDHTYIFWYR